ncbi:MAG: DUF4175 family protein, partial [Bacteroidetes bacterium]|nr:DUF4175 family protein [Bacteroidota bacterium]
MKDEKLVNYDRIIETLRGVRKREESLALRRGLSHALVIVFIASLVALAIEAIFHLGVEARTALFFGTTLAVLIGAGLVLFPALRPFLSAAHRKSDDVVAREVGNHFPDMRDRLLNALQVYREMRRERHANYSPALVDAGFRDVADAFARLDLSPVVDVAPARRAMRNAAIALAFVAVAFAMLPSTMGNASLRLLQFRTDFAPPAPFEFIVSPGDTETVKGETLTLTATTSAVIQPEVTFYTREEGQEDFDAIRTSRDSSDAYVTTMQGVRTSFEYYAEARGYRSRHYRVDVVDRPFIRSLRVQLTFPSYTKLPPRYLDDNVGDVSAVTGTRVSLEMTLNRDVAEAAVVFADTQQVPVTLDGTRAKAVFVLRSEGSYHVALRDPAGIENANPIEYALNVLPDMVPTVDILEPGMNVNVDERMRLPLLLSISDDYGFSKLVLRYRLAASRYEQPHEEYTSLEIPLPSMRALQMEAP